MARRSVGSRASSDDVESADGAEHGSGTGPESDSERGSGRGTARSLPRALGLTLASALVWGVAHLITGRRIAGSALLALFVLIGSGLAGFVYFYRDELKRAAVQSDWLQTITIGCLVLAVLWVAVVVRSYQVARPGGLSLTARTAGAAAVAVLCVMVATPMVFAAQRVNTLDDALSSIFRSGSKSHPVNTKDPWNGRRRVNVLLLGGDAAANRVGVRTDSMTLASIDTKTGDTLLLSLPRNLENFPMPYGPARDRFPDGFTGDGPQNPGLLNEVFEYAENHPDVVPGATKNQRGPELLMGTISGILQQPVDYYVLVDMFGFADIIDAMGGVRIKVTEPIPYGLQGQVLEPGDRVLKGKDALWYGRSRTNSDDYTRMGRQKCLLRAVAKQASPQKIITRFEELASATKRAISTDIPRELLPAFIDLSDKVKDNAKINSLQFVPPLINTAHPDFDEIHRLTAKAISDAENKADGITASPTPTGSPDESPSGSASPGSKKKHKVTATPTGSATPQTKSTSLDDTCPS